MGKSSRERQLGDNEAMARGRALRVSPRKLNLVAGLIRGKTASQALADLTFCQRRIAGDVKRILQAAIANAENNHQLDIDRLFVAEASVGRAFAMRRMHARGRGRSAPIIKPFSHIVVIVRERVEEAKAAKAGKAGGKA